MSVLALRLIHIVWRGYLGGRRTIHCLVSHPHDTRRGAGRWCDHVAHGSGSPTATGHDGGSRSSPCSRDWRFTGVTPPASKVRGCKRALGSFSVLAHYWVLASVALGMAVSSPVGRRLGVGRCSAGEGRSPSAEDAAEMQRLQARLATASNLVAVLLVLATAAMAGSAFTFRNADLDRPPEIPGCPRPRRRLGARPCWHARYSRGHTTGYRWHPQLARFRSEPRPLACLNAISEPYSQERPRRGLSFRPPKQWPESQS
jgi:hypothetical protein